MPGNQMYLTQVVHETFDSCPYLLLLWTSVSQRDADWNVCLLVLVLDVYAAALLGPLFRLVKSSIGYLKIR